MSGNRNTTEFSGEHPVFSLLSPMKMRKGKFVSPEEAVRIIRDGDTIITGGFVGCSRYPECRYTRPLGASEGEEPAGDKLLGHDDGDPITLYDHTAKRFAEGTNAAGDTYYRLLSSCIEVFRRGERCDASNAGELCCGG